MLVFKLIFVNFFVRSREKTSKNPTRIYYRNHEKAFFRAFFARMTIKKKPFKKEGLFPIFSLFKFYAKSDAGYEDNTPITKRQHSIIER
jgi:hypothetical protein